MEWRLKRNKLRLWRRLNMEEAGETITQLVEIRRQQVLAGANRGFVFEVRQILDELGQQDLWSDPVQGSKASWKRESNQLIAVRSELEWEEWQRESKVGDWIVPQGFLWGLCTQLWCADNRDTGLLMTVASGCANLGARLGQDLPCCLCGDSKDDETHLMQRCLATASARMDRDDRLAELWGPSLVQLWNDRNRGGGDVLKARHLLGKDWGLPLSLQETSAGIVARFLRESKVKRKEAGRSIMANPQNPREREPSGELDGEDAEEEGGQEEKVE